MVTTAKLTIGGVTIVGGEYGSFTWPQTLGIEAPRVVWRLPVDAASKILAGPREVTIKMVSSTGKTKTIQRVYVVGEDQSPDKLIRSVIFSDVRFYLPFGWVRSAYNLTIQSGTLRQTTADGLPVPTLPIVSNLIFAPYSLYGSDDGKSGKPFNADQVALDVIDKARKGHDFPEIAFRNLARNRSSFVPNNVYVDASGEAAIGQVLGALGGLDLRVSDDANLELVNAYQGAEKATLDPIARGYSLERKGQMRWISMGNVAPTGGVIQLTRRVEVRADSWEVQPALSATLGDNATWGFDNTPTMINVLPVTDLTLPAIAGGTSSVQGTLLPVDEYCADIASLNDQPGALAGYGGATPLTRSYLLGGNNGQRSSSPLMSEKLELNFCSDRGSGAGPNVKWGARCRALRACFRQVYKLNPVFSRQCLPGSIKAERVGLLDAANATRQPATVYMDYCQRPAGRGLAPDDKFGWNLNSIPSATAGGAALSGNPQSYPTGIKFYPDQGLYNINPFPISNATPAPFDVSCLDPTTGVFKFSPTVNPTLRHEAMTLSGLVWAFPITNGGAINQGAAISYWEQGQMLLTHRVALIFSAIPGGPNNTNALHKYKVSVADALARLGAPSNAVTPRAPTRELRVREGVAQARIPWDDSLRQQLLGCFSQTGTSDPSKLVPVNNTELQDFATAVFAVYMSACLDHYEGEMQIAFDDGANIAPIGSLRQVLHTFTFDGACYTTLRSDGVVPVPAPENIISQSSRNVLFRGVT